MIKDLLNLKITETKHISFSDIPKDDINSYILFMARLDWNYDIEDKVFFQQLEYIKNKYNLIVDPKIWDEVTEIWKTKIREIERQYSEKDFLDYIIYAKELYIKTYWEESWYKAYNNFLWQFIIWTEFYLQFIKDNKKIIKYLHDEFKKIFKYYPTRWDKVWFYIDELYWYKYSWNIDHMDNLWELDRYNYWILYKDKWEIKTLN